MQEFLAHTAGRFAALPFWLGDAIFVGLLVLIVIGMILRLSHCIGSLLL